MRINFICHQLAKITFFSGMIFFIPIMPALAETVEERATQQLEDKLYRKALYFYFIGNYSEALNQINVNRQRFNCSSARSRLFEAGLQVNVGLHHQAAESLSKLQVEQELSNNSRDIDETRQANSSGTSPEALKLIALLQLAEQQIEQGDNKKAQRTLRNIKYISPTYNHQYQILNQLAYWPELPAQSAIHSSAYNDDNMVERTMLPDPYIKLNIALLHMANEEFELAEPILTVLKNTLWSPPQKTFWQLLFSPFSVENENTYNAKFDDDKVQQRAINDYAQLLLAQMYVKQERYDAAYYELENFPQNSPYTESALFIFAFSAQKIKQFTRARKLFNLMKQRFPYSNLGWQSALLLSSHVVEQMSLEEGMTSYQNAEHLYQQRLTELTNFYKIFVASDNVLGFSSQSENNNVADSKAEAKFVAATTHNSTVNSSFSTDSVWLQKALLDKELQASFQTILELDVITEHLKAQQEKNQWLQGTLALNSKRKAKVVEIQQQKNYHSIIFKLNEQKQRIEKIIAEAEEKQQGQSFANQTQEQWLTRIKASKQAITIIGDSKKIEEYQKRLQRVEGVLSWQLQQEFPERLWQHKKQLKEIEQLLSQAVQQRERFDLLAESPSMLSSIEGRTKKNASEINSLLSDVVLLRTKKTKKIHKNVQQFVAKQKEILAQHLLTARHEMAVVLESMAKQDKRIERQLSPSSQKTKAQKTVQKIEQKVIDNKEFSATSSSELKLKEAL